MISVVRTRYLINEYGEVDKKAQAKISFYRLDLNNIEELLRYERLMHPKAKVRVDYDRGVPYIRISGAYYREEIRIRKQ